MVEAVIAIVLVLGLAAASLAVLIDLSDRHRARQRAETVERFRPEPLVAPLLRVPVATGATEVEAADDDLARVGGRRDEFLALGLDELEALDAAAEIDVNEFRTLVRRGCPPRLALEILR